MAAAAIAAPCGRCAAAPPQTGRPIVEILYESHDVFDLDKPEEAKPPFRVANAIHSRTKQKVIARELLFAVGDPFNDDLLRETERNLRRLTFIRRAEVVGVDTASGTVVFVRTWDAWTMEIIAKFKRAGGVNDTKLGLADRNLFGYGKTASLVYTQAGHSVDRTLAYRDPQLFGKRLDLDLAAGEGTHSRHYTLRFGRPFFASIARTSLVGVGRYIEENRTVYKDEIPAGVVKRRFYETGVEYGYALEASPRRARRLTAGLFHLRSDYAPVPGESSAFIPGVDQSTLLRFGAEYQANDFIKQRRIQKLSREEDFNMGFGFHPSLGYAPRSRALGSTGEHVLPRLSARKGFSSLLGHFVLIRGDYTSTYVNGGNGARLATLDAQYFCRYFPRHTVAVRIGLDHGWRLEPGFPLTLGEDTGLRGYRAGQFQGNRRFLFSVEDRIFFIEDLWKLIDAGGVVFFDTGYAWEPRERIRASDLKSGIGLGLRLGATRSAGNDPVRIDVAHALNDNRLPSRWTISVQAGHSFGPN